MLVEELAKSYKELLTEWKEYGLRKYKQNKTINALFLEKDKLGSTITGIEEEITLFKSKLENMPESLHLKNNSLDMLNGILQRNMKVVGFEYNSSNKNKKLPPKKKTEFQMVDHMPQHRARMCTLNLGVTRTLERDLTIVSRDKVTREKDHKGSVKINDVVNDCVSSIHMNKEFHDGFETVNEGVANPQCPKPKKENQSGGKVFALSGSETFADDRLIRGTAD
ncbi:hypothetical protein KIW84_042643 [Lathyrus oleraceus]|uniref:Uncharacterized protein n=1 Tax=Pisum sativum TaxID=3888 RepID=A0A9D4XF13_PEA|nr:hypothetical protein KIW84_042643 [Pisum sativum]